MWVTINTGERQTGSPALKAKQLVVCIRQDESTFTANLGGLKLFFICTKLRWLHAVLRLLLLRLHRLLNALCVRNDWWGTAKDNDVVLLGIPAK